VTAWLAPDTLEEALQLRAERGAEATVLAGGTFLGILMNQGFLEPETLLSLGRVPGLDAIEAVDGELRLGAMATHRAVERSSVVREGWPVLARAFSLVASPRVRNQATVGGVLADADYASDPPALLTALGARVLLRSARGERSVEVGELIRGHYETCIADDELLVEVRVPPGPERAVYRKFRSRSSEDRPCVAVAAVRGPAALRVVVGAVSGRPQELPDACALAGSAPLDGEVAAEIARRYADGIEPMSDSRGSADYRRRVIAVEVERALEAVA
jgi:aerobic carbon-monoxide dehydrogenase medium subunit